MIRYENQCCDCAVDAYPCRGVSCPRRNTKVYYCDRCDSEIDGDIYEVDSKDLCEDCLREMFRRTDL